MNIAEGIKRIYITFATLVCAFFAFVHLSDLPNQQTVAWREYMNLKDAILADINDAQGTSTKPWEINWGDTGIVEFVESRCAFDASTLSRAHTVCQNYKNGLEGLKGEQFKHVLNGLAGLAGGAFFAWLLWLLLAWIGRGFKAKSGAGRL